MRASTQAHPRSRGENLTRSMYWAQGKGSSPLTRGKPPDPRIRLGAHGLIPAHAGKTRAGALTGTLRRAHPRSRGENDTAALLAGAGAGSSPLTRGKRSCVGTARLS